MKKILALISTLLFISMHFGLVSPAFAQATDKGAGTTGTGTGTNSGSGKSNLEVATPPIFPTNDATVLPHNNANDQGQFLQGTFLPKLTGGFIATAGTVSLIFVIISGIQMLTAYGADEKLTTAKKTLSFALLGVVIATLAYGIVQAIISINLHL